VTPALPICGDASHICLKPVENAGDAAGCGLSHLNAVSRNPMKMSQAVPSGLSDRLRENINEHRKIY
jgi:hypothetical protein